MFDLVWEINRRIGSFKPCTLAVWGSPFADNVYRIAGADAIEGALAIFLSHGEIVLVDDPGACSFDDGGFAIAEAGRVRFHWFLYGELPGPRSLRYEDYRRTDAGVLFDTDFEWKTDVTPIPTAPAVRFRDSAGRD